MATPAKRTTRTRTSKQQPGYDSSSITRRFADFHLLLPGAYSVQRAHAIVNRIEDALRAAHPDLEVTVHVEPIEERAAWEDSALVPLEQAARRTRGDGV